MTNRFTTDNGSHEDVTLVDNVTGEEFESNFEDIVRLMNELNDEKEHYCKQLEAIQNVMKDFDRGYDTYNGVEMFYALGDILKILKEEEDNIL